jgi:hypothetical protein
MTSNFTIFISFSINNVTLNQYFHYIFLFFYNLNIRHLQHALRVFFYKCQSMKPSTSYIPFHKIPNFYPFLAKFQIQPIGRWVLWFGPILTRPIGNPTRKPTPKGKGIRFSSPFNPFHGQLCLYTNKKSRFPLPYTSAKVDSLSSSPTNCLLPR